MGNAMQPLLSIRNLKAYMYGREGMIKIVDGLNINVKRGETVGLVGETGAGKTVTALSILGILQPVGKGKQLWKIEGEVFFEGRDLFKLPPEELRLLRGREIAFVPQNPIPSLHPIDIVGRQTGEGLTEHDEIRLKEVRELVVEHLGKVGISDAKKRYFHFRNQFSGGEGQRLLIAMALIRNPSLLIADEPTSSLDVTVQRQILQLLKAMKEKFNLSMILITHDLGVIAEMSNYVYVMYSGKIIEEGDVKTIFHGPLHPYTRGLVSSVPRIDMHKGSFELEGIPGDPPNPLYPISGCKFHPRCRYSKPFCADSEPQLREIDQNHSVACLRVDEIRNPKA